MWVTFEQTIPMRTLLYQMQEGVHPYQSKPHFAIPGTAIMKREFTIENQKWDRNKRKTIWNFPTEKKYGRATSGFILVCVYWDRFTPDIVKMCLCVTLFILT